MPWKPSVEGEVPTLGYYVIDWIVEMLAAPSKPDYEPFRLYREQEDFVLRWYQLDPRTGRFVFDRGLIQRPRGWGKSPLLAGLAAVEALADVVFDGWDADGQPVGRPWSSIRTPLVHIAAVSEDQTRNTWQPLLEMLREGPVIDEYPGLEPMESFINLPHGRIEQITSSARSVKGAPSTFAVLDQTEEWVPSNSGPRLAQTIRTNTSKAGGRTLESPNAYVPGEASVAEASAEFAQAIVEGRSKAKGLLWDHREAPPETDMSERESLVAGLRIAYGDSSGHEGGCVIHSPACTPGHVDLESIVQRIWDPATDPQIAQSDFLNQITHASDQYISQIEWAAVLDASLTLGYGDSIVLGFDGSRGRAKGKPDATALVAIRISDRAIFELGIWEAPDNPSLWAGWQPPMPLIEATLKDAFTRYAVQAFYCDPAKDWRSHVNAWEALYGPLVTVRASRDHPFEWWMTGGRTGLIQRAVEQFYGAVVNGDVKHGGSPGLMRHVLNTRRRVRSNKLTVSKQHDYSPHKIDATVATILAYQACLDAVAAGVGRVDEIYRPRRIG